MKRVALKIQENVTDEEIQIFNGLQKIEWFEYKAS